MTGIPQRRIRIDIVIAIEPAVLQGAQRSVNVFVVERVEHPDPD